MSGITGFFHYAAGPGYPAADDADSILRRMQQTLTHNGLDLCAGTFVNHEAALAQTVLQQLISPKQEPAVVTRSLDGHTMSIVFCGELYNSSDLATALKLAEVPLGEGTDAEVLLAGILLEGLSFCTRTNGVFAFVVYDHTTHSLSLVRDRLGVKPLFYSETPDGMVVFGSEPKALFAYPGLRPKLGREGLGELFALGPAHTPGKSIYKDIFEVLPGHFITWTIAGTRTEKAYWELTAREHEDSYEDSIAHIRALIHDAVTMQCRSKLPLGSFLSGGLDSSLVTSLAADTLSSEPAGLSTFSFDFEDSASYFIANSFQPSLDRPYVDIMKDYCHTDHHYFTCSNDDLIAALNDAVIAQDAPCMADVASSLLFFCRKTAPIRRVILTGECADEVFGGYPWFHRRELSLTDGFPWASRFASRQLLLNTCVPELISLEEYSHDAYRAACAGVPLLSDDSEDSLHRRISYLSLRWFMQTLLDRMDRAGTSAGIIPRVPFADHRLVSYLYNIPAEMKFRIGVKGMLKEASKPWLPVEIRERKKSPYPKTYHPDYEKRLGTLLLNMLSDHDHPLNLFVDAAKTESFLQGKRNLVDPWYGQLMAGPQLLAYYLQVGFWLEHYQVDLSL